MDKQNAIYERNRVDIHLIFSKGLKNKSAIIICLPSGEEIDRYYAEETWRKEKIDGNNI